MRKVGILVIIGLLAITGVMAAMAYNTATVTNETALKVVSTNSSLLQLNPNANWSWQSKVGFKDNTAKIKDGELYFEFGRGVLDKFRGVQPNSVYEWVPLFFMRNMSEEKIEVTVSAEGPFADFMTFGITNQTMAERKPAEANWGEQGEPLNIGIIDPIKAQGDMWNIRHIAVKLNIPSGHEVSSTELLGSIIVTAVAVP
jgi:hypothetical protein